MAETEKENQPTETQQAQPKPAVTEAPKTTDIVHSDAKTIRELQERLAKMEADNQQRTQELGGLRKLIDEVGRLAAPGVRSKRKGETSLLDIVNDIVFGPFEKDKKNE